MTLTLRTRWLLATVLTLLWAYLVVVLFYGESAFGFTLGFAPLALLIGLGTLAIFAGLAWAEGRHLLQVPRQKDLLAAAVSLLFCLLGLDLAYTVWTNASRSTQPSSDWQYERMSDQHIWHGELYPRAYFPTDRKFTVYKPGVRVEAMSYGEFYEARMLESPTLVDSVLQLRPLVYSIDGYGLRNRTPLGKARLFALGDSFVFGHSTTEGLTWVDRLGELLGEPVYNLGVSASGPAVQLQLLDHILRTHPQTARPNHVLWMLFEGNDLENSYAERRSPPADSDVGWRGLLEGTLLDSLFGFPQTLKRQSVLGRLRSGELTFSVPQLTEGSDPLVVDEVRLATPLYRSERWGPRLFNPHDIDRATRDESYVLSHPHRPLLDRSFTGMKALGAEFDFQVTVLVAPSAARLYGPDFETMPQPTAQPHFIRYVEELARRNGFATVDLLTEMSPNRTDELLYYRDDHHWNERGNAVVAQLIADKLAAPID